MPDRFVFYDTLPILDRDEDGLPCIPEWERIEALEQIETPNEPLCPVLERWIEKATCGSEVCAVFKQHEIECPVCRPSLRRAA
jgi:hypothetical protein